MRITDIRASIHALNVDVPGVGVSVERRVFVFVEVETDAGTTGFGLTGAMLPAAVVACIEHHLKPALLGMPALSRERIHAHVWRKLNIRGYTGVISNALSAIDIALWDVWGKWEQRSIHELIGGYRDWAPTYATFGYPFFDTDQLAEHAKRFLADGHRMLKMVVGGDPSRTWKDDVERVRCVREAIGADADLIIDANCWFDPFEARQLAQAVADCRLLWFEEPIQQNDVRALADLRAQISMPLAVGQMEGNRWRYREFIAERAVDIIQPNVIYNGGFTESIKVAHMAQAFNMPMTNGGGWPIFNMHLLCGLMNGGAVEFHYGIWQVGKHFFHGTPDPENGHMQLSGAPGLGFTPDFDALEAARLDATQLATAANHDAHGYRLRG
ncbi:MULTISPECIES: mandelate racemase/muconate lactonizing enzyme family protein [Halomonadaceae]|uniref:mandelate racemase/muconate lactonizing enzyme family protein n=1 Tax=Halomonadaceae TaxID=28256 RepID=UPI001599272A|nr:MULTISPECIES: mandelate racemase/muconate lactonizing enzyme family protein [Halomonas]QJQ95515.1 mandelate racemase/muconate lactonizing enzyme family protein [Halomonas sp. PA5]